MARHLRLQHGRWCFSYRTLCLFRYDILFKYCLRCVSHQFGHLSAHFHAVQTWTGSLSGCVSAEPSSAAKTIMAHIHSPNSCFAIPGLLHTHAGGCDPTKSGDAVDDTPASLGGQSACTNTCCTGDNLDTCPDLAGLDPVDNYMSYAGDNRCRVRFTTGQLDRMRAQYELYRKPATQPVATQEPVTTLPVCSNSWLQLCETSAECCSGICSPLFCLGSVFSSTCSPLNWCSFFGLMFGF